MPRGRQYYDPIVQLPGSVDGERDLTRVEFYMDEDQKWKGRLIDKNGRIVEVAPGDLNYDGAMRQAQQMWPGLTLYELRGPQEDSTWDGVGPSPRTWAAAVQESTAVDSPTIPAEEFPKVPEEQEREVAAQGELRAIMVTDPGMYVSLNDICTLLEQWAEQYAGNPSAEVALRDAASALRDAYA